MSESGQLLPPELSAWGFAGLLPSEGAGRGSARLSSGPSTEAVSVATLVVADARRFLATATSRALELAFLALASTASATSGDAIVATSIRCARRSAMRQRVQRGLRTTGCGAAPARTSWCQVLSETPLAWAQVGPSTSATSASALGTLGRLDLRATYASLALLCA